MKPLYKSYPKKFLFYDFIDNPHRSTETGLKDWLIARAQEPNMHLEVHIDKLEKKLSYSILANWGKQTLQTDSFLYNDEEDALNSLYSILEEFAKGDSNKKFILPYAMYKYLKGGYSLVNPDSTPSSVQAREELFEFIQYFKRNGTNLKILLEITSLGKASKNDSPKMLADRFMRRAPLLTEAILIYNQNKNKYIMKNVLELTENLN